MRAALIALVVLAAVSRMHVAVTVSGVPLSVPVLGIVAAVLGCALGAAAWLAARAVIRQGGVRIPVVYNPQGG